MASPDLGVVVTIGGLLVFLAGLSHLLPCLSLTFPTHLDHCWADFLLTVVGALLFTR
jgi:hypothetical protein